MSATKFWIVGAVAALAACHSDRMHITHDLRATPPDSFSTKDAYAANDTRMSVNTDTTVKATQYDRYEDRYDRNADKNRAGTPEESFSTSDPYVAKPLDAAAMRKSVALTWMERDFVSQALSGSRFEVESSQLALQKEISGRHRDFAQTMIADHGALNRDLERIAQRKGVNVSADVDSKHNLLMAELRDLDGHAFEQRYHDIQVAGHEQMIQLLENASRDCDDPELKALAQKALPTVRHHLELLKDIDVPRADSKDSDSDSSANSDQ